MDDLDNYIQKRKNASPDFAQQFEDGYESFKFDVLIRQAREQAKQAGLTKKDIKAVIKQARGKK